MLNSQKITSQKYRKYVLVEEKDANHERGDRRKNADGSNHTVLLEDMLHTHTHTHTQTHIMSKNQTINIPMPFFISYQHRLAKRNGVLFAGAPVQHVGLVEAPFDNKAAVHLEAEIGAIGTELGEVDQKEEKVAVVVGTDAAVDPCTVVVESADASLAHGTMLGACRSVYPFHLISTRVERRRVTALLWQSASTAVLGLIDDVVVGVDFKKAVDVVLCDDARVCHAGNKVHDVQTYDLERNDHPKNRVDGGRGKMSIRR